MSTPTKVVPLTKVSPITTALVHQANGNAGASPARTAHYTDGSSVGDEELLANVMAAEASPVKQTPPKTVLPKDYDPTTGWTPLGAEGWQVSNARVNCDRPGVPGHTFEDPFFLATPARDKK